MWRVENLASTRAPVDRRGTCALESRTGRREGPVPMLILPRGALELQRRRDPSFDTTAVLSREPRVAGTRP